MRNVGGRRATGVAPTQPGSKVGVSGVGVPSQPGEHLSLRRLSAAPVTHHPLPVPRNCGVCQRDLRVGGVVGEGMGDGVRSPDERAETGELCRGVLVEDDADLEVRVAPVIAEAVPEGFHGVADRLAVEKVDEHRRVHRAVHREESVLGCSEALSGEPTDLRRR